jgi:hypothetical protein
MGNKQSQIQQMEKAASCDYFIIDRVIAPTITIGVTKQKDEAKPLSRQGIRYANHGPIYRLQDLKEENNCLHYSFEEGVTFKLCKEGQETTFELTTPEDGVTKQVMNPKLKSFFKPISMASQELDKIAEML